jgi:hypothetical protein
MSKMPSFKNERSFSELILKGSRARRLGVAAIREKLKAIVAIRIKPIEDRRLILILKYFKVHPPSIFVRRPLSVVFYPIYQK